MAGEREGETKRKLDGRLLPAFPLVGTPPLIGDFFGGETAGFWESIYLTI